MVKMNMLGIVCTIVLMMVYTGCGNLVERVDEAINAEVTEESGDSYKAADEEDEVIDGISKALDTAKNVIEDFEDGDKSEEEHIADVEALLGIESNVNEEIGVALIEQEKDDQVSGENKSTGNDESKSTVSGDLSILGSEFPDTKLSDQFYMEIQGTITIVGESYDLYYETYFKGEDIRIDTYWDGMQVARNIYNSQEDVTYTEYMRGTHFAEVINGNVMPIRLIDFNTLDILASDQEVTSYTSDYRRLNDEEVFYYEVIMQGGMEMAFWYSLAYHVPIKYYEKTVEEGESQIVQWEAVLVDLGPLNDDVFALPEDIGEVVTDAEDYYGEASEESANTESSNTSNESEWSDDRVREVLLYGVSEITDDETALNGAMTQIFFYTNSDYDEVVAYYMELLQGTNDYFVYEQEDQISVDGSLGDTTVMIIVNDFKKTEGGKTGVNANWINE